MNIDKTIKAEPIAFGTAVAELIRIIDKLPVPELIELHNEYCGQFNMEEDFIFLTDSWALDELPCMTLEMAFSQGMNTRHFSYSEPYAHYDGRGYVETCDNIRAAGWVSAYDIANETALNRCSFGNKKIADWLIAHRIEGN